MARDTYGACCWWWPVFWGQRDTSPDDDEVRLRHDDARIADVGGMLAFFAQDGPTGGGQFVANVGMVVVVRWELIGPLCPRKFWRELSGCNTLLLLLPLRRWTGKRSARCC